MDSKLSCPVCSGRMQNLFKKFGYGFFQCRTCKFAKFHPPPAEKDILKRYSQDYFYHEYLRSYGASPDSVDMDVIHSRFDFVEAVIRDYLRENKGRKRILDIGCGAGFLLKIFQERGWEVLGLDIIDSSVDYARELLGVSVEKCNFENVDFQEILGNYGRFDVVAITDSLEHFFNPLLVLKKSHRILKNRGILWVGVPNIQSISFRYIGKEWAIISPLEHLSYFSPLSLRKAMEMSGFEDITINVLQYVNLANVHKKNLRYLLARMIIYLITRMYHLGFEGKESYHDVLNEDHFRKNGNRGIMGDALFAIGQKKNDR